MDKGVFSATKIKPVTAHKGMLPSSLVPRPTRGMWLVAKCQQALFAPPLGVSSLLCVKVLIADQIAGWWLHM